MATTNTSRFHPRRWTALTWLAVLLWGWFAFPLNYPPSVSWTVDPVTGELSEPTYYKSLADIPFPVGWPLNYLTPSHRSTPLQAPVPLGTPPPSPTLSTVSYPAMAANLVLIGLAIAGLVYVLQKTKYRFSLLFLLALLSAFPLYFALRKLVVMLAGTDAGRWYTIAVYFSPIVVALGIKYSVWTRMNWPRFRWNWKSGPRAFDEYDNPDNAIFAAARLDKQGDWPAAIALYRHAAKCWPEHTEYTRQCIERIAEKQALAQPSSERSETQQ